MNIRLATKDDIPQVAAAFAKVFLQPPYNESWPKKRAEKRVAELLDQGKECCLLAETSNEVIGFTLARIETWHHGDELFLAEVGVVPSTQQQGIGSALVAKITKLAKSKGITKIRLSAEHTSKAFQFWEKQGFTKNTFVEMEKRV